MREYLTTNNISIAYVTAYTQIRKQPKYYEYQIKPAPRVNICILKCVSHNICFFLTLFLFDFMAYMCRYSHWLLVNFSYVRLLCVLNKIYINSNVVRFPKRFSNCELTWRHHNISQFNDSKEQTHTHTCARLRSEQTPTEYNYGFDKR